MTVFPVTRSSTLDADGAAAVLALAGRAEDLDGVAPLNEAAVTALLDPGADTHLHLSVLEDGGLVGHLLATQDVDGWQAELVVEPHHRRRGVGSSLIGAYVDAAGEASLRIWAHGDLPGAAAVARVHGFEPVRTLLKLARPTDGPTPAPRAPAGTTTRTFVPGQDEDALLAVNARAFAHHPEQGRMDAHDLAQRTGSDWFDPAGLFLVEDAEDGRLLGFHWTKVEDGVGEVYVVGVDTGAQGRGLGTYLTAVGLHHLTSELALPRVDLYVEGDNAPALAVYRAQGFVESSRDVLYRR
ncbi:mycothiol synthase [Solicola sp. PLA-1-18]|uniref:mycothiol synthase n=1 Tax=Solicola sp. PLA-1-18 TaxID=3380532 RepID=UPI003B7DFCDB